MANLIAITNPSNGFQYKTRRLRSRRPQIHYSFVPASVPSDFQSSKFVTPLSAVKYSVLPAAVRYEGLLLPLPGLMSFTGTVPAAVPSLFQSS